MIKTICLSLMLLLGYSSVVTADFEQNAYGLYAAASYSTISDDPDGDVEPEISLSHVGATFFSKWKRDIALVSDVYAFSSAYSYEPLKVGQDAEGITAALGVYKQWVVNRRFKPWFGAALAVNSYEFSERILSDADGTHNPNSPNNVKQDRDETYVSLQLNAFHPQSIGDRWQLLYRVGYDIPFADGVEALSFGASILYTY